jgi:hypothetical protein
MTKILGTGLVGSGSALAFAYSCFYTNLTLGQNGSTCRQKYNFYMKISSSYRKFSNPWGSKSRNKGGVIKFQFAISDPTASITPGMTPTQPGLDQYSYLVDWTKYVETSSMKFLYAGKHNVEYGRR